MINKETGELRFPTWNESLARNSTREWFLKSSLGQNADIQVKNGPYCSWKLAPTQWDNKWWAIIVYFEEERLYQLIVAASETEASTGWENWSEERERDMKSYYATVLEKLFGFSGSRPYEFPWGMIEVVYDERSAGSYIIIKYDKK